MSDRPADDEGTDAGEASAAPGDGPPTDEMPSSERRKRFGPLPTEAETTPPQRVSAAVCSLGLLYFLPLVWTLFVLVARRGPGAAFERSYAWAALVFQLEVVALVAVLTLPAVLDDGRTPGLLAFPALVALVASLVSVVGAVSALVGSGFAWPSLPVGRAGVDRDLHLPPSGSGH